MSYKLSSSRPENEDDDGLSVIANDAVDEPGIPHVIIAIVDTKTLTTDMDSGAVVPTLRFKRLEVVPLEHREAAYAMFSAAYADRTGQDELPFAAMKAVREGLGQRVTKDGEVTDIKSRQRRRSRRSD